MNSSCEDNNIKYPAFIIMCLSNCYSDIFKLITKWNHFLKAGNGGRSSEQYREQSFESKLFGTASFKHILHKNWVDFGVRNMRDSGPYFLWTKIRDLRVNKLKS